ncbi:hypothetical protein K488DRAFT_31741, partial [Vararia minispora EC-137]
ILATMAVPQLDQPALRYPEDIPPQAQVTHEDAVRMLLRAVDLAQRTPFVWKYVDKPADGTLMLFFVQQSHPPPLDGIRYIEPEQRYAVQFGQFVRPVPRSPLPLLTTSFQELEIHESRFGFIPGREPIASHLRRRFRLVRGGYPALALYHWTHGPQQPVPPQLFALPARRYPLPPVEQPGIALFVLGENKGKRVPVQGGGGGGGGGMGAGGQQAAQQQVQLQAQNQHMAALERQRAQAQAQAHPQRAPPAPPRLEEEPDPAEDIEHITTRTLAMARYRRNGEFMADVFVHAALG